MRTAKRHCTYGRGAGTPSVRILRIPQVFTQGFFRMRVAAIQMANLLFCNYFSRQMSTPRVHGGHRMSSTSHERQPAISTVLWKKYAVKNATPMRARNTSSRLAHAERTGDPSASGSASVIGRLSAVASFGKAGPSAATRPFLSSQAMYVCVPTTATASQRVVRMQLYVIARVRARSWDKRRLPARSVEPLCVLKISGRRRTKRRRNTRRPCTCIAHLQHPIICRAKCFVRFLLIKHCTYNLRHI